MPVWRIPCACLLSLDTAVCRTMLDLSTRESAAERGAPGVEEMLTTTPCSIFIIAQERNSEGALVPRTCNQSAFSRSPRTTAESVSGFSCSRRELSYDKMMKNLPTGGGSRPPK
jgi:hypothetical protein